MDTNSLGKNIRKYRLDKKLKQDQLAEKTDLSTAYIGMIERGEKIPSLESFLNIANALGVSADMLLCDLLSNSYEIKNTMLDQKLQGLSINERNMIYEMIDIALRYSK